MKKSIFLIFILPFAAGCEVVASFYVEKAWVTDQAWTAANPDMKTRLSVDFKVPVGADAKKAVSKSK